MKRFCLTLLLAAAALPAHAHPRKSITLLPPIPFIPSSPAIPPLNPYGEHYVQGYTRRDGTYIPGHFRANTPRRVSRSPFPTLGSSYSPAYPSAGSRPRTVRPYYDTFPAPVLETRPRSVRRRSRSQPPPSPPVSLPSTTPVADPTVHPVSSNDEIAAWLPALIGSNAAQVSDSLAGSGYWLYKTHTQKHGDSAEYRHGDDGVEIYYVNGQASRWEMRSYR